MCDLFDVLNAQVAERVCAYDLGGLFYCVVAGDEIVPRVDVRSVVARVHEARSRDAHVDLLCACVPEKADYPCTGSSSYDGVVYQHDALVFDYVDYRVQFDLDLVGAALLAGGYESSSDVLVFDETDLVRYAGLPCVADRRVESRVRNAYYDVSLDRMFKCEKRACSCADLVDTESVDDRVGP